MDLFMFYDEGELLDIRLNTLKDIVDQFVLVESTMDFRERPKPLNFRHGRIPVKYLVMTEAPEVLKRHRRWRVEFAQRRFLINGIDCEDDDIIMISDIDEIPRPDILQRFLKLKVPFARCRFSEYVHWMNCWHSDRTQCTVIMYRWYLRKKFNDDIQAARQGRRHGPIIGNAGWHFHAIGGLEAVQKKISLTAHSERDRPDIREGAARRIENNMPWWGKPVQLKKVPIDDRFPPYVLQNMERFGHLFC